MLVNTHSFKMSKGYICYLEYGDPDGLTEEETKMIDDFLYRLGIAGAFYEYIGLDDSDFGPCDITGLGADRVTINVWQDKVEEDKE